MGGVIWDLRGIGPLDFKSLESGGEKWYKNVLVDLRRGLRVEGRGRKVGCFKYGAEDAARGLYRL